MGLVGIHEGAYRQALERGFDSVAADAGSLDPGPYYLGAGLPHVLRYKMKADCQIMMEGLLARKCRCSPCLTRLCSRNASSA